MCFEVARHFRFSSFYVLKHPLKSLGNRFPLKHPELPAVYCLPNVPIPVQQEICPKVDRVVKRGCLVVGGVVLALTLCWADIVLGVPGDASVARVVALVHAIRGAA
jgi:hypothetical protein